MKEYNLKEAIEKRRIISFSSGPKLVRKELKTAKIILSKRFPFANWLIIKINIPKKVREEIFRPQKKL